MTIVTSHTIEWEVGGEIGVGVTIGEGVIPGGVNLSAAFDSHIISGNQSGIEQSAAWDLPAEPNTIMEYTLAWRELWQPGSVEVQLADQSIMSVNVRYRTGIQSDIIGQRQLNCEGSVEVLPTSELQSNTPTPPPQPATIETFPTVAEIPPTSTPIPIPTSIPNTLPGIILEIGQTWYQDGAEVTVREPTPWTDDSPYAPEDQRSGMSFRLFFTNHKPQDISITYSGDFNFTAVDNLGRQLVISDVWPGVVASSCHEQTRIIPVGQTINLGCRDYSYILAFVDIGNPAITEIIFTVTGVSSIHEARWRIPIYH
jgi:hypothetical protein